VIGIGQDTNWDLRNYHFYNPFAYLTGRMGHDVAVSHVATYYNPLLYIPFYYAVTGLPPKAVGFILGLLPGFNILFLYAIARRVIDLGRPAHTAWFCWRHCSTRWGRTASARSARATPQHRESAGSRSRGSSCGSGAGRPHLATGWAATAAGCYPAWCSGSSSRSGCGAVRGLSGWRCPGGGASAGLVFGLGVLRGGADCGLT
jgi:hypothetical protein